LDDNAVLAIIPNAEKNYKLIRLHACDNVAIRGGTLKGNRRRHQGTGGEWGMGVHVGSGCERIMLSNIHSREMWGDGFYIGGQIPPKDVTVHNCVSDFNRRQGLSIVSGSEIAVIDSRFANTRGTRPQSGIDIEPNRKGAGVHRVLIKGNQFINNGHVGIQIAGKWAPVGDVIVRNNQYIGQRPLKIKHAASDYRQSTLSKLFCLFRSYRLEITDCRLP
jgi:Right handed beta helix region